MKKKADVNQLQVDVEGNKKKTYLAALVAKENKTMKALAQEKVRFAGNKMAGRSEVSGGYKR